MLPSTLQYSATAATPVNAAGTTTALVTVAPEVGIPMAIGLIASPLMSTHDVADDGGTGKLLAHPAAAATTRVVPNIRALS